MPRRRLDVESALQRKGFQKKEGDHHFFIFFTKAGLKSPVFTKTSHGMREISDNLISAMAKQCGLSRKQFLELVDCTLDQDAYEAFLSANNKI